MPPQSPSSFIEHRTRALATVALTRSQQVQLLEFQNSPDQDGIDYFLQVFPEGQKHVPILRGIGVAIKGTAKPLDTREQATSFVQKEWWGAGLTPPPKFSFPVILLVFSMKNDKGYYAWFVKPDVEHGRIGLVQHDRVECHELNKDSLDELVSDANKWYAILEDKIFATQP